MKKIILIAGLTTTMVAQAATTVTHYGFVKASYLMTSTDFDKNWKPGSVSDEDGKTDLEKEGKSQISSTNSRWGMNMSNGSKTTGKFEFDLDANEGAGAQALSVARVRQANLSYKASEQGTITFGKKWTKFMGVNPNTYRFTTVALGAGNTGFIVDGVDYTHSFGDTSVSIELASTGTADVNDVSGPTKTILVSHVMGDHNFGLAYTFADLKYKTTDDTKKDGKASGTKLFWNGKFGATSANLEYTMGSNLGAIHTGGRANSGNDDDFKDTSYIVSVKHAFNDMSVFATYGSSKYNDEDEATAIASNSITSIGFDTTLDAGLTAFIEHSTITTGNVVSGDVEDSAGSLTEIGMVYKF